MSPELYSLFRDIVLFGLVPLIVWLWGRERKLSTDAIDLRFTAAEESLELRFTAFKAAVASSFELRDHRLNMVDARLESAAERSSREGGRITEKMEELRDRLVRVEAEHGGRRVHDS